MLFIIHNKTYVITLIFQAEKRFTKEGQAYIVKLPKPTIITNKRNIRIKANVRTTQGW